MGPRIWLQMQQSAPFAQAKMRYGIPFSAGSTRQCDYPGKDIVESDDFALIVGPTGKGYRSPFGDRYPCDLELQLAAAPPEDAAYW